MRIGGDKGATYAQIDEGAKYFKSRISELQLALHEETIIQDKLKVESNDLTERRITVGKKLNKINSQIRITVTSEAANANALIDLRYLVDNAVWKPYYSLRAQDKDQAITLQYQAQIYNDTGNDWNNKPLTLAVLDPSDEINKPSMEAWILNKNSKSYNKKKAGRLSRARNPQNRNSFLHDMGGTEVNPQMEILALDDLSTRFEIQDLHLIPSDATPHLIDVTSYTKDADYYTLSIPKIKEGAFLIATISDWENLGLLDGPVNLYYNSVYQGVSQLDTKQVSDTLEISMSKDNSFSVSRRKLKSNSNEKLIGLNIRETLTYEFIVKNNKSESAKIELRDQIPVSTSKDASVKLVKSNGAKLDALSGQLSWKLDLKPHESKRIILKFSVKYPKSKRGILQHNATVIATPRYF